MLAKHIETVKDQIDSCEDGIKEFRSNHVVTSHFKNRRKDLEDLLEFLEGLSGRKEEELLKEINELKNENEDLKEEINTLQVSSKLLF